MFETRACIISFPEMTSSSVISTYCSSADTLVPDVLPLRIHQRHVRTCRQPAGLMWVRKKRILLGKQPGVPPPWPSVDESLWKQVEVGGNRCGSTGVFIWEYSLCSSLCCELLYWNNQDTNLLAGFVQRCAAQKWRFAFTSFFCLFFISGILKVAFSVRIPYGQFSR